MLQPQNNSHFYENRSSKFFLQLKLEPASQSHSSKTHQEPIQCFNADTKRKASVILRVPGLPADNPQQSEEASHMGGNANCKCRKCKAGGTHEFTESDAGYHLLHFVSCEPTIVVVCLLLYYSLALHEALRRLENAWRTN